MRRYSEAVRADVRRRMSSPHRQSVARISEELGIHAITFYKWRKTWLLQGEVVPASEKEPEGWSAAADKFTVVMETAGLNSTELSEEERQRIQLTCNQPEYASLPPGQIVPALADQKPFIGSESSFYLVLHQTRYCRGRAKPGLELGHHLSAHHGAGCVAVPLPGGRCVEPQGGGLGCRRGSVGPDRR